MKPIGIDSIAIAVPERYVELAELARARGVVPEKFTIGLGVERMAVAAPHEDPVALAAGAANRVLERGAIDRDSIGLCVVGTETGVDHSKPVAAYLHRLLELPDRCRVYETKHACFGGTAGLMTAVDWIASGSARGRSALVICTDIARYALNSPGEPTQGAGAVAFVVSENPRLVALEVGASGSFSRDVDDFWRPLWSKEAVVDGHYSVQCYLDALEGAYRAWKDATAELGIADEPLVRRCYHVPYGKMAKKAHRRLVAIDGGSDDDADASYGVEVAASLRLPAQVGNIYTGSLYLGLASLLAFEAGELEGSRIGLFSYGSGCAAEFFAGRVVDGAAEHVAALDIAGPLEQRSRLDVTEYEQLRARDAEVDSAPVGDIDVPAGAVGFRGVESDRRVYG